jgi:hypothetical protein
VVRLIQDYDERNYPLPDPSPVEMLTYLLEQRGLKQADLEPVFRSKGCVSDVLNGRRAISKGACQTAGRVLVEEPPLEEKLCAILTGKERDSESGRDYFGAEYYWNSAGRFTSPDAPLADQPLCSCSRGTLPRPDRGRVVSGAGLTTKPSARNLRQLTKKR